MTQVDVWPRSEEMGGRGGAHDSDTHLASNWSSKWFLQVVGGKIWEEMKSLAIHSTVMICDNSLFFKCSDIFQRYKGGNQD